MNSILPSVKVPFCQIARDQAPFEDELLAAAARVMREGRWIGGPEVAALERELGDFVGREAVACASGTDALVLALKAAGVRNVTMVTGDRWGAARRVAAERSGLVGLSLPENIAPFTSYSSTPDRRASSAAATASSQDRFFQYWTEKDSFMVRSPIAYSLLPEN